VQLKSEQVGAGKFRNALIAILARALEIIVIKHPPTLYDIVADRMTRESSSVKVDRYLF